jgi:hypothetical protein
VGVDEPGVVPNLGEPKVGHERGGDLGQGRDVLDGDLNVFCRF